AACAAAVPAVGRIGADTAAAATDEKIHSRLDDARVAAATCAVSGEKARAGGATGATAVLAARAVSATLAAHVDDDGVERRSRERAADLAAESRIHERLRRGAALGAVHVSGDRTDVGRYDVRVARHRRRKSYGHHCVGRSARECCETRTCEHRCTGKRQDLPAHGTTAFDEPVTLSVRM